MNIPYRKSSAACFSGASWVTVFWPGTGRRASWFCTGTSSLPASSSRYLGCWQNRPPPNTGSKAWPYICPGTISLTRTGSITACRQIRHKNNQSKIPFTASNKKANSMSSLLRFIDCVKQCGSRYSREHIAFNQQAANAAGAADSVFLRRRAMKPTRPRPASIIA